MYATAWTCTQSDASTSDCVVTATASDGPGSGSTTPLYTQDAGNIVFSLAIIIFCLFLLVIGFVWNSTDPLKRLRG